jgi:hypothetical protein
MRRRIPVLLNTFIITAVFVILSFRVIYAESDVSSDTENCLLCHRYPLNGRYDATGTKRIFYVNETSFAASVHGRLRCKSCHTGLDEIPHTDVKKVDCSTKCHLDEPSTKREFSHENIIKIFEASAHGAGIKTEGKPKTEDSPTCKYCHDNRILDPATAIWSTGQPISKEATGRCFGCHTEQQWAERFYSHVSHRMRRRRTQVEIIELCNSCHEDAEMMARSGLKSVDAFRETFHWVQVQYGVKNAPDCLSCHVPVRHAKHDIRKSLDPLSPVHVDNRVSTCQNEGGVQICHPDANERFVSGREHGVGMKASEVGSNHKQRIYWQRRAQSRTQEFLELLGETTGSQRPGKLHDQILTLVKWFYKILIANVIGFMCIHQLLDFIRAKRKTNRFQ